MSTAIPTVTGYSPFWNERFGAGSGTGYTMLTARNSLDYHTAMHLSRNGNRTVRRTMRSLLGATTGSSKAETVAQIRAGTPFDNNSLAGARPVDTVTLQSGNTTAADLTYMQNLVDRLFIMNPTLANYPVDASGNGGGGKAGSI